MGATWALRLRLQQTRISVDLVWYLVLRIASELCPVRLPDEGEELSGVGPASFVPPCPSTTAHEHVHQPGTDMIHTDRIPHLPRNAKILLIMETPRRRRGTVPCSFRDMPFILSHVSLLGPLQRFSFLRWWAADIQDCLLSVSGVSKAPPAFPWPFYSPTPRWRCRVGARTGTLFVIFCGIWAVMFWGACTLTSRPFVSDKSESCPQGCLLFLFCFLVHEHVMGHCCHAKVSMSKLLHIFIKVLIPVEKVLMKYRIF